MIDKPLLVISIIANLLGLSGVADRCDSALALYQAGNVSTVTASRSIDEIGFPEIISLPSVKVFSQRPSISAKNYLLGDLESGKILLSEAASDSVAIASTTKIMTAVVALDKYNVDDVVTVSEAATTQIGSSVFLRVGEQITVKELLHCLLIKSGNDSAYALAEHLSGEGVNGFVELMNKKALELDLKSTRFLDPAGLNDEGKSSAEDLFKLTRHALKNQAFSDIVSLDKYTAKNTTGTISHPLENSNRLVGEFDYIGAIGVKTGYTPVAGHCLVSAVEREGHTLIGVVLNTYSDTATASALESRKLMDWGWQNIEWR
ncbi:MAG: D-alanyl-D-alanine carboxypeptidase DacB precursor [bacterium ADurb.Bin212]|nr:MAG: D-alanyl-D-alanine carboxypeptidase DacB precursor [bacterium ADurb.Bin212]